ncbi:MAG: type II toxin-antitoxin system VapC family toxin [Candidatus Sericytochromatia bacterium]
MKSVFVDTGAWFACFASRDVNHQAARTWLETNTCPLVTSDYVIDELLTLLKVRENTLVALSAGQALLETELVRIEYLSPELIAEGWQVFQRYQDKGWSFTDCTSKVLIEKLGIGTAFAFDHHFAQFGNLVRVP